MAKIKIGDIFEINTPKGKAYLHYIYVDPKVKRELIRVLPGLYAVRPTDFSQIAASKEQYMIFFPVSAAHKRKIIEIVGYYSTLHLSKPKYMRAQHNIRGEQLGWFIIDTDTWQRQLVRTLNDDQRNLSDWAGWNDTLLIERLADGWNLHDWV